MSSLHEADRAKDWSPRFQDGHEIADMQPPGDDHDEVDDTSRLLAEELARPTPYHDGMLLSTEDTIRLFKFKIEEEVRELLLRVPELSQMRPRLPVSLDLSHSKLQVVPEVVVGMIKDEVERLSLAWNQLYDLPLLFSECSMQYLNLRHNRFKKIPEAVYKLTQLKILDVSRNNITDLSQDVGHLTRLRVLAIEHNQIRDLPAILCEMSMLQILRVKENPLTPSLKHIMERHAGHGATTEQDREAIVTAGIKAYLSVASLQPISLPGSVLVVEGHHQPQCLDPSSFARSSDLHIIEEHPNARSSKPWQPNDWDADRSRYSDDQYTFGAQPARSSDYVYVGTDDNPARSSDYIYTGADQMLARSSHVIVENANQQPRSSDYYYFDEAMPRSIRTGAQAGIWAGKDSGVIYPHKWCTWCERDGHEIVDCPIEDAFQWTDSPRRDTFGGLM